MIIKLTIVVLALLLSSSFAQERYLAEDLKENEDQNSLLGGLEDQFGEDFELLRKKLSLFSDEIDQYIRWTFQGILIAWALYFGLIKSIYAYTQHTRIFVRYVKYSNPKNELNQKLFTQVKQQLSQPIQVQDFSDEFDELLKEELNKYYRSYFKQFRNRPGSEPSVEVEQTSGNNNFKLGNIFRSGKKIQPVSMANVSSPSLGQPATGSETNLLGARDTERAETRGNFETERWLNQQEDQEYHLDEISHKLLGYFVSKYTGRKYRKMRCCSCSNKIAYQQELFKFQYIEENSEYFFKKMHPQIFDGISQEEKALIIRDFNKQEAINQGFVLDIDPRACALRNFLQLLSAWLAFIIYLRFFVPYFEKTTQRFKMFVAIMTTTLPMLEKMGEDKVKTPEAYIWTRIFIISVKGMFMVSIFVLNDLPNDLFISLFFWISSTIGMIYFNYNPYFDPSTYEKKQSHIMSNSLSQIQIKFKKEVYTQKLGQAYRMVCMTTVVSFVLMVALVLKSNEVAIGILNLKPDCEDQFLPTSLALTSVIMILYNFFAWVEFNQNLGTSTKFTELDKEIDRAKLLIQELDHVCNYCSTLKQLLSTKDQKPDKKQRVKESAKNYNGFNVQLLDTQNGDLIVQAKLRSVKKFEDSEYSYQYQGVEVQSKQVIFECFSFEDYDQQITFDMQGQELKFILKDKMKDHFHEKRFYDQIPSRYEKKYYYLILERNMLPTSTRSNHMSRYQSTTEPPKQSEIEQPPTRSQAVFPMADISEENQSMIPTQTNLQIPDFFDKNQQQVTDQKQVIQMINLQSAAFDKIIKKTNEAEAKRPSQVSNERQEQMKASFASRDVHIKGSFAGRDVQMKRSFAGQDNQIKRSFAGRADQMSHGNRVDTLERAEIESDNTAGLYGQTFKFKQSDLARNDLGKEDLVEEAQETERQDYFKQGETQYNNKNRNNLTQLRK